MSLVVDDPPDQVQPVSIAHVELHPSLLTTLPSSQYVISVLKLLPSPHISDHVSLVVDDPPDQVQPVSIAHVELHPSLLTTLPSSQYVISVLKLLPSPHISDHVSLVVDDPPDQVQPVSIAHVELHPSLLTTLPSSQYVISVLKLLPSPHISDHVSLVVDDPPDQVQPVSIAHVELHPSLLTTLSSSQYVISVLKLLPSPHISDHVSLVVDDPPDQVQPVSIAHVELHPSLLTTLSSSQYVISVLKLLPSPHISDHVSLVVDDPPDQVQPVSIAHVELHPSLLTTLPSSQYMISVLKLLPSPHISDHVSLVVDDPPDQVQPVSIAHVELHPSLFATLPSSQYVVSVLKLLPSPHISDHVSLVVDDPPDQVQPVSILHVELHPSLFATLPSSQYVVSVLKLLPSPHISDHVSLVVDHPPDQVQPVSILHVELHPSLLTTLPSSQVSDPILIPSPHII